MSDLAQKLQIAKKVGTMEQKAAKMAAMVQEKQATPQFIPPQQEQRIYDAREEMKRIQEGLPSDLSHCKLPPQIIESIRQNPLMDMSADPQMDAFTERLAAMNGSQGMQRSVEIQEKLERQDRQAAQQAQPVYEQGRSVNVDYEMIKMIVENAIDKRIEELKTTSINESAMPNIKTMQMSPNGNFFFVDTDNNVYECKLTYKGKRKVKK